MSKWSWDQKTFLLLFFANFNSLDELFVIILIRIGIKILNWIWI